MKKLSYRQYRKMRPRQIARQFFYNDEWWDYVTALRGPDAEDARYVKVIFAGFLRGNPARRGLVGIREFEETLKVLSTKEFARVLQSEVSASKESMDHYLSHIRETLRTVEKQGDPNLSAIAGYLQSVATHLLGGIYGWDSPAYKRQMIANYLTAIKPCVEMKGLVHK